MGAPHLGGGDGVAESAARRYAPSRLRPGEHDDRREGSSQGGRVGRESAYGADAASALRAAGSVGSGGSAGGAAERGDRTRRLFDDVNTTAAAAGLLRGRRRVIDSLV